MDLVISWLAIFFTSVFITYAGDGGVLPGAIIAYSLVPCCNLCGTYALARMCHLTSREVRQRRSNESLFATHSAEVLNRGTCRRGGRTGWCTPSSTTST